MSETVFAVSEWHIRHPAQGTLRSIRWGSLISWYRFLINIFHQIFHL